MCTARYGRSIISEIVTFTFLTLTFLKIATGGLQDSCTAGLGEERVAQEMVLGIGGVRALKELGIKVDVYHFNEGHAVFAGLELVRYYMEEKGLSFEQALSRAREKIVYTTHTPVEAGNETHPLRLLMYMGANLNLTEEQLVYIGGALLT